MFFGMYHFQEAAVKFEDCKRTLLNFKVDSDKSRVKLCGGLAFSADPFREILFFNLKPDN